MKYIYIVLLIFCFQPIFALTYVVDSNGDVDDAAPYTLGDGTNTLRKCIRLANANAGADIINFNITGSAVITNVVAGGGAWLSITDPVTIDGYTQAGASPGNLVVELNGASIGKWFGLELTTGSAGSTIRGLIIYGTNIGLRLSPNTNNNTIAGCWIGVDNTGNAPAPNPITEHGIRAEGSSNNIIGGSGGLIDRNIIGGCGQEGIRFQSPVSNGNQINGNYVGVGRDGVSSIGNRNGIYAQLVTNLVVGNGGVNDGNVVSGNNQRGIFLVDCDNFTVKGNIVGLAVDLTTVVANVNPSIEIVSGSDVGQIGGPTLNERNFISGNNSHGLLLNNSNNITIQGNYIGVAGDGITPKPNAINGIVGVNCEFTTVGGVNAGEGNVVGANGAHGISIWGADSRNTTIQGNMVGIGADGTTAIGNGAHGIELNENEDSQIGGATIGARNVVGNNAAVGIIVINSPRTVIEGNFVGVDATGLVDAGNLQHGIRILNTTDMLIGGLTRSSRNIIAGNNQNGIELAGTSSGVVIKANFIGLGVDGTTLIKNDENGVRSIQSAHGMIVGGPTIAERNVISGNGQFVIDADPDNGFVGDAVRVLGTSNHVIENNYLGTDSSGTIGLGNHWAGISLNDNSDNNLIIDNLISDNRNEGIWIYNGSDNNQIYRNIIGEDINGNPLGNWDYGLVIDVGGSTANIVGGSLANANTIAHTRGERPTLNGDGVTIGNTAGNNNQVTFNNIHCNAGKGILRLGASNESEAAPVVVVSNPNDISGTGNNGRTVHVYLNVSADGGVACDCEGETYIGSTTVVGGVWSLVHNLGLVPAQSDAVSATQTTTTGSTSEFSNCIPPILLPMELLSFGGGLINPRIIELSWSTEAEFNTDFFNIERSKNAQNWMSIGSVTAAGNAANKQYYTFKDESFESNHSGYYYRLKQVDFDGKITWSKIIFVGLEEMSNNGLVIYPSPAISEIRVESKLEMVDDFAVVNLLGLDVTAQVKKVVQNKLSWRLEVENLPAGVYFFLLNGGEIKQAFIKQ